MVNTAKTIRGNRGFALPTIMISATVMLAVMAIAISSVMTARRSLDDQYWITHARTASESGYEKAKTCLKQSNNVVTWSNAAPLRSNTDCAGVESVACPPETRDSRCGVIDSTGFRSIFSVPAPTVSSGFFDFTITAEVQRFRTSNNAVWARHQYTARYTVRFSVDATTTLAGSVRGFADSTGTSARFNFPRGIDIGPDGSLYVADSDNNCIRKVTPSGVVTTIAGTTTAGFADGTGAAARFNRPYGLRMGPDGALYVADRYNHRIRRVTTSGVVTTIAGSGTAGFADSTIGTSAQFNEPHGVVAKADGTLYVADAVNNRIRIISPSGTRPVSTLAGNTSTGYVDSTGAAARFSYPYGITIDSAGTIYVSDNVNERIRKITPGGVVSTFAGSGATGFADGTGTAAQFRSPKGLTFDAVGNLHVADNNNHRIRKITPAGLVSTIAGTGTLGSNNGPNNTATFNNPADMVIAPDGVIYVLDSENDRIRKITQASNAPPTVIVQ